MTLAERWTALVERHYRALLIVSLVAAGLSSLSLLRLRLDIDVLGMLPVGAPAFDNFKSFVSEFGELDELVVLIEAPQAVAAQGFADAFVERLRTLDSVVSVQGKVDEAQIVDTLLGRYRFNYIPAETYERFAEDLTAQGIEARVAAAKQLLQAPLDLAGARWVQRDPLGFGRLAAQGIEAGFRDRRVNVSGGYVAALDGKALLVLVRPVRNPFDIAFTTRFLAQVHEVERQTRRSLGEPAEIFVGYTGSYAFALEDAATIKADVARYSLLALAGVLAVFFAGYRNLRILPFVTYPLLLSTLLTFAAGVLLYDQLNAVSLSFAALLYGLSIDSAIHYYTRLLQELQERSLREAVQVTLQQLGGANIVASATTAAAFFVIGYSQLTGISQLGMLAGVGMMINVLQFFAIYPALSFAMSSRVLSRMPLDTPRFGEIAQAAARRAGPVILATGVFAAVCALVGWSVRFDVDLTHLRPAQTEAGRVQQRLEELFGAEDAGAALLVRGADLETALQASEAMNEKLAAYRTAGQLQRFDSVSALLPSERTQRQRLDRFLHLPRARIASDLRDALVRQGFRVEAFTGFLSDLENPQPQVLRSDDAALAPFGGVLDRYVRRHDNVSMVATYVRLAPGARLADLAAQVKAELPGVDVIGASRAWLEEELAHLLRRELIGFCLAAFLLNLLLVLPSFPRLSMAAAILIPEALVILAFLALTVITGLGIDPVSVIAVPLILGIGVDYCVYLAERMQHGASVGEALRRGGRALAISAISTMVGFGVLGCSRYPALAHMGELTAVSLFFCLIAAIVVMPALVVALSGAGGEAA